MFLFSVFTGLAFADLQSLRASQIETNSEGKRYIRKARQKTEVESLIPLHPIAEQILSLYTKEESKRDYKIFPDTMSKGKLLTYQSRGLGVWLSNSANLALCPPQLRHADLGGWHSDREHRQDDGAFVHCQHANLCPNH